MREEHTALVRASAAVVSDPVTKAAALLLLCHPPHHRLLLLSALSQVAAWQQQQPQQSTMTCVVITVPRVVEGGEGSSSISSIPETPLQLQLLLLVVVGTRPLSRMMGTTRGMRLPRLEGSHTAAAAVNTAAAVYTTGAEPEWTTTLSHRTAAVVDSCQQRRKLPLVEAAPGGLGRPCLIETEA